MMVDSCTWNRMFRTSTPPQFLRKQMPRAYMSDMFHPKSIKVQTRNSTLQLSKPSSKASGHKGIAYLAPSIWNELPSDMKLIPNLNTFKHKLKKWFLENLKKEEQNIYIYTN